MLVARVLQIVYVATPLLCWCLNAWRGKRRLHWSIAWVLACIAGYVLLLVAVFALESALEAELYTHDLNGDGAFSESEMTIEAQRAMNRVTNDTGRNLAPFTGLPITFLWTSLNFMILGILETVGCWFWSTIRRHESSPDEQFSVSDRTDLMDASNPYQPPKDNRGTGGLD